jgi:hypothetical protein
MTGVFFGRRWSPDVAPGIYEDISRASRRETVRLDVPCFIGLAERGPLNTPVSIDSPEEFTRLFGTALPELRLPLAVRLFFANGGRRCVVIRCLDQSKATTTRWALEGLTLEGATTEKKVIFHARQPGAWGNHLQLTLRLNRRSVPLELVEETGNQTRSDNPPRWRVVVRDRKIQPGDTFYWSRWSGEAKESKGLSGKGESKAMFAYVAGIAERPTRISERMQPESFDQEVDLRTTLSLPFRQEVIQADRLADAQLISLDLEVAWRNQRVEGWQDAGLHALHPRYLPRLLGRRAASEELRPSKLGQEDPESPRVEADRLWGETGDPWGSEVVRPDNSLAPDPTGNGTGLLAQAQGPWILPTETLTRSAVGLRLEVLEAIAGQEAGDVWTSEGGDASETFTRRHFFVPSRRVVESKRGEKGVEDLPKNHAAIVFSQRPGPLQAHGAVELWNHAHPFEPIAMVSCPDLCHPLPAETTLRAIPGPAPLCFSQGRTPEIMEPIVYPYPLLGIDPELTLHLVDDVASEWIQKSQAKRSTSNAPGGPSLQDLLACQREMVEACERLGTCVAMLDVPPGIDGTTLHVWRSELASDRGVMYAPWLRMEVDGRAETVPPSPAACGVAARLELEVGVWAAPANALVQGVFATAYGEQLPNSDGLHRERVDEIRQSPLGLLLLGARTTSVHEEWTHLSVRRLLDWIRLQLIQDLAWTTFEPNGPLLWSAMEGVARRRLLELLHAGALAGRRDTESFFVRCDSETNTPLDREFGRVVMLVGVAPAVPAEFLVFRLVRQDQERPEWEAV